MKTQETNGKLEFSTNSVLELNQGQLFKIKGGTGVTTLGCTFCINSSNGAGTMHLNDLKNF